jgi:hypothetical protein
MIKLTHILKEIGEGTNAYPIKNESEALRLANSLRVKMLKDGSAAPSKNISAEFVTTNNVKYFVSYFCTPLVYHQDETKSVVSMEVGFSAKNLSRYGDIRKALTSFFSENKGKMLVRLDHVDPLENDSKMKLASNKPKFIPEVTYDVEEISKIALASKRDIWVGDLSDTTRFGDIDNELSQTLEMAYTIPNNIRCWKSTKYPGIYFVEFLALISNGERYIKMFIDPSDPNSPISKNLLRYLVDNANLSYKDSVLTGKNDALRVISTVVSFAKKLGTILPIEYIKFTPVRRDEDDNLNLSPDETGRGRLYLAFTKKSYPDANVELSDTIGNDDIIVSLKQPTTDPITGKK